MVSKLTSAMALVLLVPAPVPTESAVCAKAGENCYKKGCCSTPGTACYLKTDKKQYAGCLPEGTCKKGVHEPPPYDQPWSCTLLTWGCNDAYHPCEGAKQQSDVVPCCQWGCVCNYTSKYYHQCVPPEGQNHCGKDGPAKKPTFTDDKDSEEDDDDKDPDEEKDADKEEEEEEDDEVEEEEEEKETKSAASAKKNCFDMGGGKFVGPDCPQSKVEIRNGDSAVADAVSRLPWVAAGALAMAILAASATMVARRRQWHSGRHHMLQVDPEPYEFDAETS
eukprot:CAMPEP_0172715916 /NCGR_PEP_ID=MMETSP1074-20121228/67819_1 /TAXON_ID=2916 /ORGANISM="Ceratium fusus, Strain PA161109" /LENGTH=277 /DNA_ID=CAMNT_0013540541 /DNA_START=63 /DNA_END=896 /DNA_ORIENTATION=+